MVLIKKSAKIKSTANILNYHIMIIHFVRYKKEQELVEPMIQFSMLHDTDTNADTL